MGCRDTYSSGREIQSLTEEKKRDDVYEKYWLSTFVQRGSGNSYVQVIYVPFQTILGLPGGGRYSTYN